ncbi:MAG: hypothetical protein NTZ39_10105 [Methanoregula sp.]|nr:hypothetical protein [Methanoregula sp.]
MEKLTAERKARQKDEPAARRDRAAAPHLPGMIELHGMERHSPSIGKYAPALAKVGLSAFGFAV